MAIDPRRRFLGPDECNLVNTVLSLSRFDDVIHLHLNYDDAGEYLPYILLVCVLCIM